MVRALRSQTVDWGLFFVNQTNAFKNCIQKSFSVPSALWANEEKIMKLYKIYSDLIKALSSKNIALKKCEKIGYIIYFLSDEKLLTRAKQKQSFKFFRHHFNLGYSFQFPVIFSNVLL